MIRTATPADRPAIRSLQRFLDHPAPRLLTAAFDAGVGTVLVAELVGGTVDVAGYALVVPGDAGANHLAPGGTATNDTARADPVTEDAAAEPAIAYLAELVVAPDRRRRGVGSRLVTAVGERCEGCDRLQATARADDRVARAFYRDLDFDRVADLPRHFGGEGSRRDGPSDPRRGGSGGRGARDGVLLVRDLE